MRTGAASTENSMVIHHKIKNRLIIKSALLFLGVQPKEVKEELRRNTFTVVLIAAQIAAAERWTQPKGPSAEKWTSTRVPPTQRAAGQNEGKSDTPEHG